MDFFIAVFLVYALYEWIRRAVCFSNIGLSLISDASTLNVIQFRGNELLFKRSKRATDSASIAPTNFDCGSIPDQMIQNLVGVPWHASIYWKENNDYMQICSGSIISKTVVISAAHCFWDNINNKLKSPSLFAIAIGKRRTIWLDTSNEERAQKFNITDIKVPPQFRGADGNYESDIALIILDKDIKFSWFTIPICIDLVSAEADRDSKGLISGWGVRPQNNSRSIELQNKYFTYINNTECLRHSPEQFKRYITPDKVCAGEDNDINICIGDSGAGMAFTDYFRYRSRYFLRSILTTAPPLRDMCGNIPLIGLTQISAHKDFIAKNVVLDYGLGINAECGFPGAAGEKHEMPWYAAIYKLMSKKFTRICAGSLISHNIVISAAHCFWDPNKNRLNKADDYMVALGKHYSLWEHQSDTEFQTSPISNIKIGPRFNGASLNYADDIALLFLAKDIRFTAEVRPVCINFDQDFDRQQLNSMKYAKMAGFGVAPVDNRISNVVNVVELPLIDKTDCLKRSPTDFRPFLVADKICAGFANSTKICKGDSGTGLVFPDTYRGDYKYYLRGVLSVAPIWDPSGLCGETPVLGFTWLLSHENFIASNVVDTPRVAATEINKVVKTECGILPLYLEPLSIGGRPANYSEMPWHAGIYRKKYDPNEKRLFYEQICGGSLVSSHLIISAAHCFADDEGVRWKIKRFAVAVGKLYRDWDDPRELLENVQKSNVSDIIMPDNFYGSVTRFQADIALVKVASRFQYKENVIPVCLDFDYEFDKRQLRGGNYGKVAGWGYINEEGVSSTVLKVIEEPIYNSTTCFYSVPTSSRELITTDKICGGYVDGTQALCKGDSGGGLVVPAIEGGTVRYYLRGIVSTATTSIKKCNRFSLTYFTRVRAHQYLITESLTETTDNTQTTSAIPQTTELIFTTKTLQTTKRIQTLSQDVDDTIHFIND